MKEANNHLLFWVMAFLFSLWGGVVRYLMDRNSVNFRISKFALMKQVSISIFTGFLGGLYSYEYEYSIYMAMITVGLSSTLGSHLLRLLWSRFIDTPDVKPKK